MVKAESLRYIFLIKKSLAAKISTKNLLDAQNDTHFDAILSKELKSKSFLQLITGKNYGQIVNMVNYPDKATQFPEFFRIFENHELWEKKYIKSNVSYQNFPKDNADYNKKRKDGGKQQNGTMKKRKFYILLITRHIKRLRGSNI